MLYGYGDDRNPYTETVDFLEDLVFQFITDMTHKAMEVGRQNRVQVSWLIVIGTVRRKQRQVKILPTVRYWN
jgi:transcription initiation factor TFIID subunit 13